MTYAIYRVRKGPKRLKRPVLVCAPITADNCAEALGKYRALHAGYPVRELEAREV